MWFKSPVPSRKDGNEMPVGRLRSVFAGGGSGVGKCG